MCLGDGGASMEITDWVAIYAASLSTFIFIREYIRARPRFRIVLTFGISDDSGEPGMGMFISIQNTSNHVVHISHLSILYPSESLPPTLLNKLKFMWQYKRSAKGLGWVHSSLSYYDVEDRCPTCIESRKSHEIFVPQAALEEILSKSPRREIRVETQDPLWNSTYSEPFAIDWYDSKSNKGT